jgi:outer membrane protein insertion porin family
LNFSNSFTPIGGDTQLLGNFEYRIPIFGPVSAAAYADIGSSFNLRKGRDQAINSNFCPTSRFCKHLGWALTERVRGNKQSESRNCV